MSNPEIVQIEKRQDRMEDAIERLTQISYDLNRMLAVQEQRLSQQEKNVVNIEKIAEDRREETQARFKILDEKIEEVEEKQNKQIGEIKKEVKNIEKIIWTYLGGFSVLVFLIIYGDDILAALKSV